MRLNGKFLVRGLLAALVLLIAGLVWLSYNLQTVILSFVPGIAVEPTVGPTPPLPALTAPRGALPAGRPGLAELAQFTDGSAGAIGSAFLLQLENGPVIGVTTAHSFYLSGWPAHAVDHLAFRYPDTEDNLVMFWNFYGPPGRVFTGYNFDMDYVLLQAQDLLPNAPVLRPDPRGAPVPGERVIVYSGLGDGLGGERMITGTVTTVAATAVWAQMDGGGDPGGMSGSPLVSAHTGLVVGMAVSAGQNPPIRIGFHPIGSIVAKAAAAQTFPPVAGYHP